MVTREYQCTTCQHQFDVKQRITEKPIKQCPACQQWSVESIIHGGLDIQVQQDAKTLGQLASRNTKKMGTYELQEKRENFRRSERIAREELRNEAERKIGKPIERINPDAETVKHFDKINQMTPEQKTQFIETGKGIDP